VKSQRLGVPATRNSLPADFELGFANLEVSELAIVKMF
jgi:hypothetical protein